MSPARVKWVAISLVVVVMTGGPVYAGSKMYLSRRGDTGIPTGTAAINSRPDGASVSIDGVPHGVTPLRLTLSVGEHSLQLTNGDETRTIPLIIDKGGLVSQYIDLAPSAAPAALVGRLDISSDPSGSQVAVDGKPRGVTPMSVASIAPGEHEVIVTNGENRVRRVVNVEKGATASVFLSLAPAGVGAGWIAIKAPIELQILEGGKVIGTTSTDQVMLPAGRHDLELVNEAFAFRTTITVQATQGKTATPAVVLPNGTLSINAVPWADVLLDGRPVGTTPLANVSVPIGNHEVVWRHPQYGERKQTVAVTMKAPVRVGMEFGK